MRTLAKVLRIAGKTAVGVLAAVVLLVAIAWTFLQTRQGGELVRRIALPRVNAALAGTIAVERFAFGGDQVTLENVALTDPDGQFVGRVARVDVWFSPRALLRRHVDVRAVEIRRPELALVQDARGRNLARALAPPHPDASGPARSVGPAGGSRIAIDVRALAVTGGVIDYRSFSGGQGGARGQETHVNVADLSIHGAARLDGDRVAADAAIRVRGGQADARGTFDLRTRRGEATVRASVRGVGLAADGSLDGDRIARAGARRRDRSGRDRARAGPRLRPGTDADLGPRTPRRRMRRHDGETVAAGVGALPGRRLRRKAAKDARGLRPDPRPRCARRAGPRRARVVGLAGRAAAEIADGHRAHRRPARDRACGNRGAPAADHRPRWHARAGRPANAGGRRAGDPLSGGDLDASPARPPVVGGRPRADRLRAYADGQRVAIDLRADDRERTAHVVVSRLDLGRLPRALVSPALRSRRCRRCQRRHAGPERRRRAPACGRDGSCAGGRIRGRPGPVAQRPGPRGARPRRGAFSAHGARHRGDRPLRSSGRVAAAHRTRADRSRRRRHQRRPGGRREDAGGCPGREGRPCGGAGAGVDQGRGPRRRAARARRCVGSRPGVRGSPRRQSRRVRERRGRRSAHRAPHQHRAHPRAHRPHDGAVGDVGSPPSPHRRGAGAHAVRDQGHRRSPAARGHRARGGLSRARRRNAVSAAFCDRYAVGAPGDGGGGHRGRDGATVSAHRRAHRAGLRR